MVFGAVDGGPTETPATVDETLRKEMEEEAGLSEFTAELVGYSEPFESKGVTKINKLFTKLTSKNNYDRFPPESRRNAEKKTHGDVHMLGSNSFQALTKKKPSVKKLSKKLAMASGTRCKCIHAWTGKISASSNYLNKYISI